MVIMFSYPLLAHPCLNNIDELLFHPDRVSRACSSFCRACNSFSIVPESESARVHCGCGIIAREVRL